MPASDDKMRVFNWRNESSGEENCSMVYCNGNRCVMDAKKFGMYITETRKERQMIQSELAEKIRVTDKAVSRWERGLGFPDINTL